jgi:hypothetical protein
MDLPDLLLVFGRSGLRGSTIWGNMASLLSVARMESRGVPFMSVWPQFSIYKGADYYGNSKSSSVILVYFKVV